MNDQVEYVARAFFDAEDHAQAWDYVSEDTREELRQYARDAIMLLVAAEQAQEMLENAELSYAA